VVVCHRLRGWRAGLPLGARLSRDPRCGRSVGFLPDARSGVYRSGRTSVHTHWCYLRSCVRRAMRRPPAASIGEVLAGHRYGALRRGKAMDEQVPRCGEVPSGAWALRGVPVVANRREVARHSFPMYSGMRPGSEVAAVPLQIGQGSRGRGYVGAVVRTR
jgi:hypothetical protein